MILRRDVLAGGAVFSAASQSGSIAPQLQPDLRFDVMRDGKRIGQHTIRFRRESTTLEVEIDVDIAVRVGPIVLYRYVLKGRETWQDGEFVSLETETNDGGTPHRVKAARTPERVVVEAQGVPKVIFPGNAIPLTHWNNLCMDRPLFNPQDGAAITSKVLTRGEDRVYLADGSAVRAIRYSLIGKVVLDDWYDMSRHWTALRAPGRDGSTIEYRRTT